MDRQQILSQLKTLEPGEAAMRLALIDEAMTWIGTPYHTNADIKGVGVDCGMILIRVFSAVGAIEFFDPRPYPEQWALRRKPNFIFKPYSGLQRKK
jgi:cell wall-associated NlpC family hydrolase